jgi:hypothetical protein
MLYNLAEFFKVPNQPNRYRVILESVNWDEAVQKCRELTPRAHLVILGPQLSSICESSCQSTPGGLRHCAGINSCFWLPVNFDQR